MSYVLHGGVMLGRRIFVYSKGLVLGKHVNVRGRAKFYVRTKVH